MQNRLTIEELSNKLKPLFGKKIDELYFRYSVANSLEEKNEIIQILTSLYQKHLNKLLDKQVLLEPPRKELVEAEYPLAKVNYAGKGLFDFGLREKDWPRHVCVSGMSGSGKTTFAINVLKNFIDKDKPFLVFDWKSSFRPLTKVNPDIATLTVGNDSVSNLFKLNINRPPKGVHPKEWINTLCDLLTESFSASFGVHKILLETLDEIYEGWGIYDGQKHYPNWLHVKKMLEAKAKEAKGRETGWYESAMRIASVLTFGSFGKVVNYDGKKSISIEDLFDKKIILELNSLSSIEKKFFAEYVLTYIYKLKKANPNSINSGFQYAILVDEAHNVFLKKQTSFMSESVTDMIYREMREYGISLICLDQHISKLSDTVTGNSACHIAFQQQLPADIETISSLMQMRDRKEDFSELPVGTAVVKLSERYTRPFLVNVPTTNLRNFLVTDEEIKSKALAVIDGSNAQKYDKEFVNEISENKEIQEEISKEIEIKDKPIEEEKEEVIEISEEKEITPVKEIIVEPKKKKDKVNTLTETQNVLYNFAKSQIIQGKNLIQIESLLEEGLHEKLYSQNDILIVVNELMKERLSINKISRVSEETIFISEQKPIQNNKFPNLSEDEKEFVFYLENNPTHQNSTVELYKKVGLSPRKGNVVKNKLMEKGLIKIEEEKYEKGWKKFIRLTQF